MMDSTISAALKDKGKFLVLIIMVLLLQGGMIKITNYLNKRVFVLFNITSNMIDNKYITFKWRAPDNNNILN